MISLITEIRLLSLGGEFQLSTKSGGVIDESEIALIPRRSITGTLARRVWRHDPVPVRAVGGGGGPSWCRKHRP